jgi:hypothetical protein
MTERKVCEEIKLSKKPHLSTDSPRAWTIYTFPAHLFSKDKKHRKYKIKPEAKSSQLEAIFFAGFAPITLVFLG